MKKVLTSFALVSALASSAALAEQSGAFVGIDGGYSSLSWKNSGDGDGDTGTKSGFNGFRYGLVGGYKYFLDENLGFRGYARFTHGTKNTKGGNNPQWQRYDLGVNADVLYNFLQSGDLEYGAFGGLSLDYANNKYSQKNSDGDGNKVSGFDLGINLGLRMNYTQTHGFELWSRFGVVGPKKDDVKVTQPYSVGLRYTFNF